MGTPHCGVQYVRVARPPMNGEEEELWMGSCPMSVFASDRERVTKSLFLSHFYAEVLLYLGGKGIFEKKGRKNFIT